MISNQCVILIAGGREVSRPYRNVGFGRFDAVLYQEIILSSGFFRRETASGFYPWGNVGGPRKRVAEGLCGWRHGNTFPMTRSAQSLRQMRSIPLCSKAVFYVFFFDSIHDSATIHNLSPEIFHWTKAPLTGILWYKKLQPWRGGVPRLWIFFGSSSFGAAYFLFCFDQLSFKPMVRLNTSFSAVLSWSTQK